MTSHRSRAVTGIAAAVLAVGGLTAMTMPAPASAASLLPTQLLGSVPSWAHGTPLATLGSGSSVDFVVQMAPRDAAGLKQFAQEVNDPSSASYHHYLTAQQYAATYGPTPGSVTTVESLLKTAGLSVDSVTAQGSYLAVHGPATAVGALFGTSFGTFKVGGLTLRSPLSTPIIPAALRGLVANVAGLAQSAPLRPTHITESKPDAGAVFLNAQPCSAYYGEKTATDAPSYDGASQPYSACGYTGQTLRKAYGLDATGLTGKGATIGIVDAYASPTILQDADTYATKHGEQPFAAGQFTENVPVGVQQIPEDPTGAGLIDPDGWAGEETLDVEAAHSMAPQANVIYQTGVTPYGPMLYLALAALVEQGKAQIISDSFGTTDDSPLPTDQLLFDQITDQAAAQGITIAFSSGDDGDETDPSADGERTADFPATSDGVVAVGGTTLAVDASGDRQWETYWGTRKYLETADRSGWDMSTYTYGGAGGGGVSTTYAEPTWQQGVVPVDETTFVNSTAGRVVPDLSLVADPTTGFLMGQTQAFPDGSTKYSEYRIGGTSLACPLFAGMLALAVEKNGGGLGLVTPTLYDAAKASGIGTLFNDPQSVPTLGSTTTLANIRADYTDTSDPTTPVIDSLRTLGNLATLHAQPGFDDSTGLGTPKIAAVIEALTAKSTTPPAGGTGSSSGSGSSSGGSSGSGSAAGGSAGSGSTPGTTPGTTSGAGAGSGATAHPKADVAMRDVTIRRHGKRMVAVVRLRNRGTMAAVLDVVARAHGKRVALTHVRRLAAGQIKTVRLTWRYRPGARQATVMLLRRKG